MRKGTRRVLRMGGTKNKPSYVIVIPREIAEQAKLEHGEELKVSSEGKKIIIEREEA